MDNGFERFPLAESALAAQGLERLTLAEREAIESYAHNGFLHINQALWDQRPLSAALVRRIEMIRSGLAKYPLPQMVRATREAQAHTYGIVDEESARALRLRRFTHRGFLSASGMASPPRSTRHNPDPVILDLLIPAGVPALRLAELSEVPEERELLVIDSRTYLVVGVKWDDGRRMWRIEAIVEEDRK